MAPADPLQFMCFQQRLSACLDNVATWMRTNRLQLNTNRTDLLWCSTARRQHQLPTTALRVGPDLVSLSPWVRDFGIFINADLSMYIQVQWTVASCFATLRQLRSLRRSVLAYAYQSLVVALVLSRLDYGNITLIGIPAYQLLSSAARSITGLRRSDHITDTLASLHWLRSERIQYKLVTMVFWSLHGLASLYLSDDFHRLVDIPLQRRLRSASSLQLDVPRTHRHTIGDRAFAAATVTLWNSLTHDVIISMTTFFFLVVLEVFT